MGPKRAEDAVPDLPKARALSLLLVDDDRELCGMMQEYFSHAGHTLDTAYDGRDGLGRIASRAYDLVLLDVMNTSYPIMPVLLPAEKALSNT